MVDTSDPKSPLQQQHAVLVWSSQTCVMEGAFQLRIEYDVDDISILSSSSVGSGSGSRELVDMCWSDRDARHALPYGMCAQEWYYCIMGFETERKILRKWRRNWNRFIR